MALTFHKYTGIVLILLMPTILINLKFQHSIKPTHTLIFGVTNVNNCIILLDVGIVI